MSAEPTDIIQVTGLHNRFGANVLHEDLSFSVHRGEVMGVVGGSGTGKSVLLRTIIGLNRRTAGEIVLFPDRPLVDRAPETRWGVLFQDGALFSSLTVAENIMVPMREHLSLSKSTMQDLAALKIALAGLPASAGGKFPSELSGGMRKRAGLARAIALDPEIIFLDEPTAGLDPIGANAFDHLIRDLTDALGITVVMVTHDLDSLTAICDRIAVLVDKRIRVGTLEDLMEDPHPWIQDYFHGPRGRAAQKSASASV